MNNFDEAVRKAVEYKLSGRYNCSQAVVCALKEECGLDEKTLYNISAGFCAGMGNMKGTCGSLVGAVMVAGLKTGGAGTLRYSRAISESFEEKSGALICKDLKTMTNGKPLCACEDCVKNAVLAYAEVLGEI